MRVQRHNIGRTTSLTFHTTCRQAVDQPALSQQEDDDAQSGIRVNAICPGYVRTPMAESIARQSNPEDPESVLTEMAKAIPLCRLADPLEVGELAAFLASDESSYLTGTQNVIDGGSTLPETVSVGI